MFTDYCDCRWSEQPKKSTWRKGEGVKFWASLWNGPRESRKRWEDENLMWCPKTLARVCSIHKRDVQTPTSVWITIPDLCSNLSNHNLVSYLFSSLSSNLICIMKHLALSDLRVCNSKVCNQVHQGRAHCHSVYVCDWACFILHTASHKVMTNLCQTRISFSSVSGVVIGCSKILTSHKFQSSHWCTVLGQWECPPLVTSCIWL